MRPEAIDSGSRLPAAALAVLCAALAAGGLAGCAGLGHPAPPPANTNAVHNDAQAVALAYHLDAMQKLAQGQPADQAALLSAAQKDFETDPTPAHQLHYALLLAVPGHAGSNASRAEQLLRPLATLPTGLGASEQALAIVQLQDIERALSLVADNQRLQDLADRSEHDRAVANSRRLQQEIDENAKLRKDLDEARAKLDAIANIERHLTRPTP